MKNRVGKEIPKDQLPAELEKEFELLPDFSFPLFESQLEKALDALFTDWSRLKGWNLQAVVGVLKAIVTGAPALVPLWAIASPADRRTASINAINKRVDIPIVPESVEAWAIGYVYDAVFSRFGG